MKEKFLNLHTYLQVCGTYSAIEMWNLAVSYVYWAGSLAQHHACIQYIEHISSLLGVYNFRCWSLSYVNWRIRYDNTYWIVRTHMYMTWIRLMNTIKSVWNKSERQIFYINTCTWNLKLWCSWNYLQGSNGDADIETDLWTQCVRGWDEWGEYHGNTTTTCKTGSQGESAVLCRELQSGAVWQPREVGRGGKLKREGTYVYLWLIHVDVWRKPTQYSKAIILQLK